MLAILATAILAQLPVTWQVSPAEAHDVELSTDGTQVLYAHDFLDSGGWVTGLYLHDRLAGTTTELARSPVPPSQHESTLTHGGLSADGRFVAYSMGLTYTGSGGGPVYVHQTILLDTQAGTSETISVDPAGAPISRSSLPMDVSADGRYVLFTTFADDVLPGDDLHSLDLFRRDRQLGVTELVSLTVDGQPISDDDIASASISADGDLVAFSSDAYNLVSPFPSKHQVFVRSMSLGVTFVASATGAGVHGSGHSDQERLSPDGRWLVFRSWASNLDPADTNGMADVFCKDLLTGALERVSVSSSGGQGSDLCGLPDVSEGGRYVAFESYAPDLVPGDQNGLVDVFLRDRWAGVTRRISLADDGSDGFPAIAPTLSGDGRYAAFVKATLGDVGGFPCCSPAHLHDTRAGGPWLDLASAVGGGAAVLDLLGASPGGPLLLAWSLSGQGELGSPFGLVDLAAPLGLVVLTADGLGELHLTIGLPSALSGLDLWVQAADPLTLLPSNASWTTVL